MTADRSPLLAFAGPFADATRRSGGQVRIADESGRTALNLRIDSALAAPVAAVLGTELPTRPNTVAECASAQVLWLGPDEWLVLNGAADLEVVLRSAAGETPLSLVDVSAARAAISLSGAAARPVLAHGCAIDLDAGFFPSGCCAQTKLALTNVVLLAPPGQDRQQFVSAPRFLILVRASFAHYLAGFLLDAATEYLTQTEMQLDIDP